MNTKEKIVDSRQNRRDRRNSKREKSIEEA